MQPFGKDRRADGPGLLPAALLLLWTTVAWADRYDDTVHLFKEAGKGAAFFGHSYGYAVFPTIGKAGLRVGGAHGRAFDQFTRGNFEFGADVSAVAITAAASIGGQKFSYTPKSNGQREPGSSD